MTTSAPIRSLRVTGLASIADLTLELPTDITVLVGPNGAGKSNIIAALELLGRIVDGQLRKYVVRSGGFTRLLHRSIRAAEDAKHVSIEVWGSQQAGHSNGYRVELRAASGDVPYIDETVSYHVTTEYAQPWSERLRESDESQLRTVAEGDGRSAGIARYVLGLVSGCRVFHFHDTSADAPVKRLADGADNITLAPDAQNIAPLLSRLSVEAPSVYRRIVRAVQTVAPFFDDFVLRPEAKGMRLRWREKDLDTVFSADELSDGTLRFICLATLLLQPERPGTVVLDEPELGLHPFAIHQLAALIRSAATGHRRIVLATQSVTLLSQFDVEEIVVVSRSLEGTRVERPNVEALRAWLDDYSLGDLWEKNLLGGSPRPDAAAPPARTVNG